MNKLRLAGVALLALAASPAMAAPPIWTWTGFYLGPNLGFSWGRSDNTLTFRDSVSGVPLSAATGTARLDGGIGGGQIGANWQNGFWVLGLEADIQASGQAGGTSATCAGGTTTTGAVNGACSRGHVGDTVNDAALSVTAGLSERLRWFGTVRGRVGGTITPSVLAYATGGLAYGGVDVTDAITGTNVFGTTGTNGATLTPVAGVLATTTTKLGFAVGGGIETVLGNNWTGKLEFLYIDIGTVSGSFTTPVVAPSGAFVVGSFSSHVTDSIFRGGLNYRFGP